jgi:hypothetical protein
MVKGHMNQQQKKMWTTHPNVPMAEPEPVMVQEEK